MRRLSGTALALLLSTTALSAQELPPPEDLQARVSTSLPGFWEPTAFRLIASVQEGDPINPVALIRFELDVSPKADLFAATGERVGPFDVVVKTFPDADTRTLYGTVRLSYRAGQWSGEPVIENPVRDLGQPQDLFTSPVLELGSERQKEILATIRSDAIAEARAAMDSELARLRREHQAALEELTARQASEVAAAEDALAARIAENAAERARVEEENAAALARLETQYTAKIAALRDEKQPLIEEAEAQLAQAKAELEASLKKEAQDLLTAHEAELIRLKAEHGAAKGALLAQQAQELATIETGFEAKKAALEKQIADADAIIENQEKLIEQFATIDDNNTYVGDVVSAQVALVYKQRTSTISALPSNYFGTLLCTYNQKTLISRNLELRRSDVFGNGMKFALFLEGKEFYGVLSFLEDEISIPAQIRFVVTPSEDWPKIKPRYSNHSIPDIYVGKITSEMVIELHNDAGFGDLSAGDCVISLGA